jgi:hypothetical protein
MAYDDPYRGGGSDRAPHSRRTGERSYFDRDAGPRGRPDRDRGRGYEEDDRGFFDRAGDEVRSWFGDDEAEARRERDHRYDARHGGGGRDDDRWGRPTAWRGDGDAFGGGWGNQRSEDPRHTERGGFAEGYGARRGPMSSAPDSFFAAPGYDAGFAGPRFDRADAGHTGTHGVHPTASATGYYGGNAGSMGMSSARRRRMIEQSQGSGPDREQGGYERGPSAGYGERGAGHDPHYSQWRQRQLDALDRDYDEYCREHQSRFDQEFASWRERRGVQRQALAKVKDHMEVLGSDGGHVGKVDKVRGDHIVLTRSDSDAGGVHHRIPCSWIDEVGDEVRLNRSADQAKREWQVEERSRALFERPDQGVEGPHMLNRSFSGTYPDDERGR